MKLGFLVRGPFSFEESVKLASEGPFDCLEVNPQKEWLGDTDEAHKAREAVKKLLKKHNVFIASIMAPLPSLRTPAEEMDGHLKNIAAVMDLCNDMGGAVYTGAAPSGYDNSKRLEDNVAKYKEVYTPVAELATEKGVKIGFENWPGRRAFGDGGNLPITPQAWEMMFSVLPTESIGLEFDPSHLMWQWIDPYKAAKDFVDHIFIVHLKDTQIFYDRLERVGNHARGWWTYRLPGFGELDWHLFFNILYEAGYEGNMVIEHEDPVFSGDRVGEGFMLCGNFLRKVMLD